MKKLAIITTHPIQYYAPIFKLLNERGNISIKVFYTLGQTDNHDHGFGKAILWDIPLLEGYPYDWVQNTSTRPGSHHYAGIVNPGLVQQIEAWNPDAILFFGWAYRGHLKAMQYFKGKIPVYFRGDSTLLNERKGVKKIIKYLYLRWIYRSVDHAFYVGTNNKAYFKRYGLKESQLSFAPHAIDIDRFEAYHTEEIAELRSSLNIKNEAILVLYAGKFEPVKNVELLLTAFIGLNNHDAHLLLAGNGVKETLLKEQAKNSKLASNIHFLDFKNQTYMPVLYQSADLFCLPSLSESWGLAVNEAMACSRAVLVSDKVGCGTDLVKEKYNGAIFKSEDVDDLASRLKELLKSKKLLADYGNQSGSMIKDWNFSNTAIAIENKLMNETI